MIGLPKRARDGSKKAADKPLRFASIIIIVLMVFLGIFTVVMTVVFCVYSSVPDSLVAAVFGVAGVELMSLAAKRIFENRRDDES